MLRSFCGSLFKSWPQRAYVCASSGQAFPASEESSPPCGWQVSSFGRVRSSRGVVSYGSAMTAGYRKIRIGGRDYQVHRVVASTFLGPSPTEGRWQVNHIDGNPSNNKVSNLCYVTPSENAKHAWATNRNRRPGAVCCHKPVLWRLCGAEAWSYCLSKAEAVRQSGVSLSSVSRCCSGAYRQVSSSGKRYEFHFASLDRVDAEATDEIWHPAQYPGIHASELIPNTLISNHGRVQNTRFSGRVTYGSVGSHGYLCVRRSTRGLLVHRLVAATFLGQPTPANLEVNHKDGDRRNNKLHNLEYVTRSQNVCHSYTLGRDQSGTNSRAVQGRKLGSSSDWVLFPSIKAAALGTGLHIQMISKICRGHRRESFGWEFRLLEEEPLPGEEWRPVVLAGVRVQRP